MSSLEEMTHFKLAPYRKLNTADEQPKGDDTLQMSTLQEMTHFRLDAVGDDTQQINSLEGMTYFR